MYLSASVVAVSTWGAITSARPLPFLPLGVSDGEFRHKQVQSQRHHDIDDRVLWIHYLLDVQPDHLLSELRRVPRGPQQLVLSLQRCTGVHQTAVSKVPSGQVK